eukprot:UN27465
MTPVEKEDETESNCIQRINIDIKILSTHINESLCITWELTCIIVAIFACCCCTSAWCCSNCFLKSRRILWCFSRRVTEEDWRQIGRLQNEDKNNQSPLVMQNSQSLPVIPKFNNNNDNNHNSLPKIEVVLSGPNLSAIKKYNGNLH